MNKILDKKVGVILLLIIIGSLIYQSGLKNEKENIVTRSSSPVPVSIYDEITCTYPRILNANYLDSTIEHSLPKLETNPLIFTFSDLEEDIAKLKFIDATQTISEVLLAKIFEDNERLIFIDGTGDPYFSMHTIFKETGISIYTKQASFLGIPSGSLAIGNCI